MIGRAKVAFVVMVLFALAVAVLILRRIATTLPSGTDAKDANLRRLEPPCNWGPSRFLSFQRAEALASQIVRAEGDPFLDIGDAL
ncbi:MAG TPA: hypothetical protein VEI26_04030 [Terriglobales bacterium]|nr:hypothetical protein [Terriglobales bacterium]